MFLFSNTNIRIIWPIKKLSYRPAGNINVAHLKIFVTEKPTM